MRDANRFPWSGLLALAAAGFVAILSEALPAGLLPAIATDLGVSVGAAGQLVTLYALGSVLAAIPMVKATRAWRRRPLLLMAIGGFGAVNVVTALSTSFALTLVARFGAGMFSGLLWDSWQDMRVGWCRQAGRAGPSRSPWQERLWPCRWAFRPGPCWAGRSGGAGPSA